MCLDQMKDKILALVILAFLIMEINVCHAHNSIGSSYTNEDRISLKGYTDYVMVEFENVRGANKYEIRYDVSPSMKGAIIEETGFTQLKVLNLQPRTVYYFQGRVLHASEWSDWSDIESCKTASFSTTVGTYNILSAKYDSIFPNNTWKDRKESVKAIILQPDNNPDILGIQEGMQKSQVAELAALLNGQYDCHISSRNISPRAIFWKPEKYSLVDFDDNIEVLDSRVSGHFSQRYITYVRLKEKVNQEELLVINLHAPSSFYADKEIERNILASILVCKAQELSKAANNAPVIVLGDFNAYIKFSQDSLPTAPMIVSNNGFMDTFNAASDRVNAYYNTHDRITKGTASSGQNNKRIDYIFCYPAHRVTVSDYRIVINFGDNSGSVLRKPIPSDHRPVCSRIHLYY